MADEKITALAENTAPEDTDLLVMVDDPGGAPATQKITFDNAGLGIKQIVLHNQLLAAPQANFAITVSGDPDWIEILLVGRTAQAAAYETCEMYFNGDTTRTNYRMTYYYFGSSASSGADNFPGVGYVAANTATANHFGVVKIRVFDPTDATRRKNAIYESFVNDTADGSAYSEIGGVLWENTAAITSIVLQSYNAANWASGSRCIAVGYKRI